MSSPDIPLLCSADMIHQLRKHQSALQTVWASLQPFWSENSGLRLWVFHVAHLNISIRPRYARDLCASTGVHCTTTMCGSKPEAGSQLVECLGGSGDPVALLRHPQGQARAEPMETTSRSQDGRRPRANPQSPPKEASSVWFTRLHEPQNGIM